MCGYEKNPNGIKIKGHIGTWYVIGQRLQGNEKQFLLEHEIYGEDTPSVIVNDKGEILLENVLNGFDDLDEFRNNL